MDIQTNQGIHPQVMYVCENPVCSDPVAGEAIPCQIARAQPQICGWEGKHFKEKEEKPSLKEGNVIQLERHI